MGIVAAESNGTVARNSAKIRYAVHFAMIAFAIIANFHYIEKITVHRKNFNFRYACNFLYDSEFSLS